jgi:hypothetical protein
MDETRYVVSIDYKLLGDEVAKGMRELQEHGERAHESMEGLKETVESVKESIHHLAEAWLSFEGVKKVYEYSEAIEESKNALAASLSLTTGADFEKSWDRAALSVKRFTDESWESNLPVDQLVKTMSGLSAPLLQAQMSLSDIEKFTINASEAAIVYGKSTDEVSESIQRAIMTGQARDIWLRRMLGQKGVDVSMKQFQSMSGEKRAEALQKAFGTEAIHTAYETHEEEVGASFEGIKNSILKIANEALEPVFEEIGKEVRSWNKWIKENHEKLIDIGHTIGQDIVKGLHVVEDVFKWLWDHSDTLIEIAKAYAAIKIGSMVGGGIQNVAQGLAGLLKGGGEGGGGEGALLGMAAAAGAWIGNKLEDRYGDMLSGTKEWNGQVLDITDKTTRKFYELESSMGRFDSEVASAAKRLSTIQGAGGTKVTAMQDVEEKRANDKRRAYEQSLDQYWHAYLRSHFGVDSVGSGKNEQLQGYSHSQLTDIKDAWLAHDQKWVELTKRSEYFSTLRSKSTKATDDSWAELPKKLQKGVDQQAFAVEAQHRIMEKAYNQTTRKSDLDKIVKLDPKDVADILKQIAGLNVDPDKNFQAKPAQQTVNITVQRVMAKDPNRWLADMDDMVARRTRGRTRAKNSWRVSPR